MRYLSYFLTATSLIMFSCNSEEDLPGSPPVADAGGSIEAFLCSGTILLDGSNSSDPDNDSLTYIWTLEDAPAGGSSPNLNNVNEAIASITPTAVGTYIVQLSVSDGVHPAVTDQVQITIDVSTNQAPTADAGEDRSVNVGQAATLDGTGSSDPDNDPLTYQWSLSSYPIGGQVNIENNDQAEAQFTPPVAGRYVFNLRITDGTDDCSESSNATLVITAQ